MALEWVREDTPVWDATKQLVVGGAPAGALEIALAVDPRRKGEGVGAFIVSSLEQEAAARGVNYLYNAVRPTHPDGARVTRWLENLGFKPSGDGLLKKRIRS